jgi:hypothetical protein
MPMLWNFFPLSLTTRPNKLEGLSLETLSSQVLEFEGKARANPIGGPFRCVGKLLLLPANVRLYWKVIARYKHSSLFGLVVSNEAKKFYNIGTRWQWRWDPGTRRPRRARRPPPAASSPSCRWRCATSWMTSGEKKLEKTFYFFVI